MADQPALSHNPTSIAGAALTTISAVLFIVYVVLEAFGLIVSPYAGLLGYLLVPALFVLGPEAGYPLARRENLSVLFVSRAQDQFVTRGTGQFADSGTH